MIQVHPSVAALFAQSVTDAAEKCNADERVRINSTAQGISIGITNDRLIRNERVLRQFPDGTGGYLA